MKNISFLFFIALGGILIAVTVYSKNMWKGENPVISLGITPQKDELLHLKKPATVLFGGDMQFDRYIRTVLVSRGEDFVFGNVRPLLQSVDLVVANLEGPITDNPSLSVSSREGEAKNYVFTFPSSTAELLKNEHVDLVNIGNNHILNFKEEGVGQTKKYLTTAGVDFFGSPLENDERVKIETINETRIAFVNYNQFVFDGEEKVLEDLARVEDQADFIVVYAHWGKEYESAPQYTKDLAHKFIDNGADLVIGSHPHVVQEHETYKGKMVYYSLGNFIFDQYFRSETMSGLLVEARFDPVGHSIQTSEIPIRLRSTGQTILLEEY